MQVYQACFESPVTKGKHILSRPPGEWELRVVQEVNLLQEQARSLHQCIQRGTHHYLHRLIKSLDLRGSLTALAEKLCFTLLSTTNLSVSNRCKFGKSQLNLVLQHFIPHQRFTQESLWQPTASSSICKTLLRIWWSPKVDIPPSQRLCTDSNWSILYSCHLLFPLSSRTLKADCSGLIKNISQEKYLEYIWNKFPLLIFPNEK